MALVPLNNCIGAIFWQKSWDQNGCAPKIGEFKAYLGPVQAVPFCKDSLLSQMLWQIWICILLPTIAHNNLI